MALTIEQLTPPLAPAWCARLTELLWHKGEPWVRDVRHRAETDDAYSVDRWFVALDGQAIAGHVWMAVSAPEPWLGLVGHVYTPPAYRRRGISGHLLDAALSAFATAGGQLMQLFTSTPYTIALYERFGFESLYTNQAHHAQDWYMCAPPGTHTMLKDRWPDSPGTIRRLTARDLPEYCLLYNLEHASRLKDWAQGIGMGLEAELAFIQSLRKQAAGQGLCHVLTDGQVIAGVASLMQNDFPHQAHVARMDVYLYGQSTPQAAELVASCLDQRAQLGIEHVYAAAADEMKRRLFQELGFQPATRLAEHYRIGDQRFDLQVFRV